MNNLLHEFGIKRLFIEVDRTHIMIAANWLTAKAKGKIFLGSLCDRIELLLFKRLQGNSLFSHFPGFRTQKVSNSTLLTSLHCPFVHLFVTQLFLKI